MTSAKLANLIKMANQISANICYTSQDDVEIAKVVNHLKLFWAKSMKQDIIQYYQDGGDELSPVTKQAIAQLSEQ